MKVEIINKDGVAWSFKSVSAAKQHIKKARFQDYEVKEGVRVYDDRDIYDEERE